MIVIGTDAHKGSHALAAVNEATGRVVGQRQIDADDTGHLAAVRWAQTLDRERVWALEDCRHVSQRLEAALLAAGERVIRVPPHRTGGSRRSEREPGKSDQIDALAVARVVIADGIEKFAEAVLDEQTLELRALSDHREQLVNERTRVQNRLRWQLVILCPEFEARLRSGSLSTRRGIRRVTERLEELTGTRAQIARQQLAHIRQLNQQIDQLQAELHQRIHAQRPWLLEEQGCAALTAAILIGHTGGTSRYRNDSAFAMQTGTAPIKCGSGKTNYYRLNRGGDRQLNRAPHTIALTRARLDPHTKAFLERKRAEGKTKAGAMRALKRHLARRFYQLLAIPPLTDQPTTLSVGAPAIMSCV